MNKILVIIAALLIIGGGIYVFNSKGNYDDMSGVSTTTNTYGTDLEGMTDLSTSTSPSTPPAGISTSTPSSTGQLKTFTVVGANFSFTPSTLTVNKGDRVKIIFKNSGGFHDFTLDEFNVATRQIQGGASETVEFTADKAGSFEYYCSVGTHRQMGMKGTLLVK